jgi:hypothetical protein
MRNSRIVKLSSRYERCIQTIREGINIDSRLPGQVFIGRAAYHIFEFDDVMAEELWKDVQTIAQMSAEEHISCAIVQPDPTYFKAHFGYYGAFEFDVRDSAGAYVDLLSTEPRESPADSFLHNSNVIAACGVSKAWKLWAERSFGIGILAVAPGLVKAPLHNRYFAAADALHDLVALEYSGQVVPPEIQREFLKNYSAQKM